MKTALLRREVPYPDESIRGYMIRLSQANGTSPRKLYKLSSLLAGVDPRSLLMITSKVDISSLIELTNVNSEELLRSTFFYEFGQYGSEDEKILRHISSFGMCSTGYCQVCPVCLTEKPYHRKHWEIKAVTTCHIHQCKLVFTCPGCNQYISPIRRFVTHCNCRFDLRKCNFEEVTKFETNLAKWLYEKLYSSQTTSPFLSNKIDELSFRHFLYLHLLFSYYNFQILSSNVKIHYSRAYKPIYLHESAIKTFQMLTNWPQAFHSFIDSYRLVPKSYKENVILKEFGAFHYHLFNHLDCSEYSFVTKAFLNYCEDKSTDAFFLKKLKGKMEKRISQNGKYIDVSKAESKYVNMKSVVNILGIPEYIILDLIKLEAIIMVRGIKARRYCALESIQKIQRILVEDIPLSADIKETVTFRNIQPVLNRKIRISEFIVAILELEIQPCGTLQEENGLNRLIFRINEVKQLLKRKYLTLEMAAELMMVKKKSLSSWIKKGFIQATGRNYRITKEDYDQFVKNYIPLTSLVKLHNKIRNSKRLYEWLEEEGIQPISGHKVDGAKAYLYERNPTLMNVMGIHPKENKSTSL